MPPTVWTRPWDKVYCCPTAANPTVERAGYSTFSQYLQVKRRADERTRTAGLISLRVIIQALQGCAGDCKCRVFRGVSFLWFAPCCTVLRSRWCQNGVNITLHLLRQRIFTLNLRPSSQGTYVEQARCLGT